MNYIPLHVYSGYSFLSSALKVEDIIANSLIKNLKFVAISDYSNASIFPSFTSLASKNHLTPIYGTTLILETDKGSFYFGVYVKNEEGYKSLCSLIYHKDELSLEILNHHKKGLILVIPTISNTVVRDLLLNQEIEILERLCFKVQDGFEDVYIGIEKYAKEDDVVVNAAREFCINHNYKPLAYPKALYCKKNDALTLSILQCIKDDKKSNIMELTGPFFFFSEKQIVQVYTQEEIENTYRLCEDTSFTFYKKRGNLLSYPLEGNKKEIIFEKCKNNLLKKNIALNDTYISRLNYELDTIDKMGYLDYFLIVSEYVNYAKSNDIPVGPGRGSACGSLVSFALSITSINPLEYGLIFERFLNEDRITLPDIDIDIADNRREEVISHIRNIYGTNRMCDIITIQTIGAKQALRDIGRVYDSKYKNADINLLCSFFKDSKTKLIEGERNSLELQKLLQSPYLRSIFELAKKIEGLPRQSSLHPAGIIINDEDLSSSLPLNKEDDKIVCQYEAIYLEELGYLKMDILGLRTLNIIDKIQKRIQEKTPSFSLDLISLEDKKTFSILNKGLTKGIFQIESEGMTSSIMEVRIDRFENISDMIALYRPGPIKQIPLFAQRKNYNAKISYIHDSLKDILSSTYGIIIYQEQIMQICQKCASFTFLEADNFRRAISKKNENLLFQMKEKFIQGCLKNQISKNDALNIYSLIYNFASYGFNKSHSVAYSRIVYEMAYLKANYPLQFYATLLDFEVLDDQTYYIYKKELKEFSLSVSLPSINKSTLSFEGEGSSLILPLSKIKGLSLNSSLSLIHERQNGPFTSMEDLMYRMYKYEIPMEHYVALINAGALDSFNHSRTSLLKALPSFMKSAEYALACGGDLLFNESQRDFMKVVIDEIEDDEEEVNKRQEETLGFKLGSSKLSKYSVEISLKQCLPIMEAKKKNSIVRIAIILSKVNITHTKKDSLRMAYFTCYDDSSSIRGVMFPEVYLRYGHYLKENECVFAEGYFKKDNKNTLSFIVNTLEPIGGK